MKILRFLFLLLVISCSFSYAQIFEVSKMKQVQEYLEDANEQTLVVFDIDMVLIQPENPAFQMHNITKYKHIARKSYLSLSKEKKEILLSLMATSCGSILVDSAGPLIINRLNEHRVPTMALTGTLTGSLSNIPNMEKFKIDRLHKLGIDFSITAPFPNEIIFKKLPKFRKNYPVYKDGILFINGPLCTKGEALVSFLKMTNFSPKKIVFVDDNKENVKKAEKALNKFDRSIEYRGLFFTGAKYSSSTSITEKQFEDAWKDLVKKAKKLD